MKGRKIWLFVLGLVFFGGLLFYLRFARSTGAAWWDDAWKYRKSLAIATHTVAQTNVYISITLDTSTLISAGKMQSDCGDLRFTDVKAVLLDYYIVSGCNSASTSININFDSFPVGAQTIYYYYGNSGVSNGFVASNFSTPANTSTTLTYYVGASSDDAWVSNLGTSIVSLSTTTLRAGNDSNSIGVGARFTGVNIGQGTTVSSATLTMMSAFDYTTGNTISIRFAGQAADNATTFTTTGTNLDTTTRPRTAYSSNYNISSLTKGQNYSFDVTTPVQAVLNRSGWAANNAMAIIVDDNSSTNAEWQEFCSWDNTAADPCAADRSNAPKLEITYGTTSYTLGSTGSEEVGVGPVALWKFDEGVGSTAADSVASIRGNFAGSTAPTWVTEDMCVSGKCLAFSGTSAYVDIGSTVAGVQTVSFWVRPMSTTTSLAVLNGASGNASISVSSGTISVGVGFSSPTVYVDGKVSSTVVANRWQMVTVTTGVGITANDIMFGRVNTGYLSGFLDEVKLYAYARTGAQVKADFSAKSMGVPKGVGGGFGGGGKSVLSQGLVGYWKMNESSGSITDYSGKSNTLTNNGTTIFVAGKFGNGSEHVPASSQYFSQGVGTTSTYYFNAADGFDDVGNCWTSDANAFDGKTTTYARTSVIGGCTLNGYGTNAPTTGDAISSVRVRLYATSQWSVSQCAVNAVITTLTPEDLGTVSNISGVPGWSDWYTLSTPTGGWNWSDVRYLTASLSPFDDGACENLLVSADVYRVEVEVTTAAGTTVGPKSVAFWTNPDVLTNYYANLSGTANIQSNGLGVISANGFTNPKIYVNGVEGGAITANVWQHVVVTSDTAITADTLYIGRIGSNYYDGTLDEVRLYDRTLSLSEAKELYNFAPGPVGHWKFEERTGSSTVDSSGNNLTGTLGRAGSYVPTWNTGRFGSAIKFDGVDDVVEMADTDLLSFGNGTTDSSFTVSAWINPTKQNSNYIATKNSEWRFYLSSGGFIKLILLDNSASTYIGRFWNQTYPINSWHYVTATYNGSGTSSGIKVYVDGVQKDDADDNFGTYVAMENIADTLRVGVDSPSSPGNPFQGQIDELKIYNYVRTPKQIVEDMNAGHPMGGSPVGSMAGYWKMDAGVGTSVKDSGPLSNVLTASTVSWTTNGKFGKAWNGLGSNWITSGADDNDFDFGVGEDFSISMWFKSDSLSNPGTAEYLMSKENASAGYAIWATATNAEIVCGIDDDATAFPDDSAGDTAVNTDYYDQTWHHLVCVRDTTLGKLILYIDGKLKDSVAVGATGSLGNSDVLTIGDRNATNDTDDFNGDIDEVKIYRGALTAGEVLVDYNLGKSVVLGAASTNSTGAVADRSDNRAYCIPGDTSTCNPPLVEWNFEERSGTTTFESMGTGITGTLSVGNTGPSLPLWSQGKVGSALKYDGLGAYVQTGKPSLLANIHKKTITAWVKRTNINAANGSVEIISKDLQAGGGFWQIEVRGNGQGAGDNTVRYTHYWSGSTYQWANWYGSTQLTDTNAWYHVAVTYDDSSSSNKPQIYINGVPDTITTNSAAVGTTTDDTNSTIKIGADDWGGSEWPGSIDQLRIYDYIRTPAQIAWDYKRGEAIAHWRLDECQGTAIRNSIGVGYTGVWGGSGGTQTSVGTCTSSGTAWGNGATGKYNSGLSFDGGEMMRWILVI